MEKYNLSWEELLKFAENTVEDEQTQVYLKEVVRLKRDFTREEEEELIRRIERDDEEAAKTFAYGHLWISAAMSMQYLGRGLCYYDVMCLAEELLGKAIMRYWNGEGEYPCREYVAEDLAQNLGNSVEVEYQNRRPNFYFQWLQRQKEAQENT